MPCDSPFRVVDGYRLVKFFVCSSSKNPYPSHEKSSEIPGVDGVLKVKLLEAKCEAKLELPGGREGTKQTTFLEGSMDISWYCTF